MKKSLEQKWPKTSWRPCKFNKNKSNQGTVQSYFQISYPFISLVEIFGILLQH